MADEDEQCWREIRSALYELLKHTKPHCNHFFRSGLPSEIYIHSRILQTLPEHHKRNQQQQQITQVNDTANTSSQFQLIAKIQQNQLTRNETRNHSTFI